MRYDPKADAMYFKLKKDINVFNYTFNKKNAGFVLAFKIPGIRFFIGN